MNTRKTLKVPGAAASDPPAVMAMESIPEAISAPDLPNAIDVDATKITSPVMTRQGWVLPAPKPKD